MNQNLVSGSFSEADFAAILAAYQTLKTKLGALLKPLTAEQKRRLVKMGEQALPYAELSLELARAHPEKLPPTLRLAEYESDWTLYRQIVTLQTAQAEVASILAGGSAAARSDLMSGFREHYAYLQRFDADPAIQATVAKLAEFFAKNPPATPNPPPPPPVPPAA